AHALVQKCDRILFVISRDNDGDHRLFALRILLSPRRILNPVGAAGAERFTVFVVPKVSGALGIEIVTETYAVPAMVAVTFVPFTSYTILACRSQTGCGTLPNGIRNAVMFLTV